jgi:hypothetical protein
MANAKFAYTPRAARTVPVAARGQHRRDGRVVLLREGAVGEHARLVERRQLRRRREAELTYADLGFGCIVASEIEVRNMIANLV